MKNSSGTKVLSIVLFIIVFALMGYIVYDKFINNTESLNDDMGQVQGENINKEEALNYEDIISEVKNKFDFTFEYANLVFAYCGEAETSEKAAVHGNFYNVSTQFSTYDEMHNYLRNYMSDDVISNSSKYNISKENYIEENEKLYCETFGKGGAYDYGDSIIEIKSITVDKVEAIAFKELINEYTGNTYQKINITLEKIDNNFVITSYEVQG